MITPEALRRHLHRHPELSFREHATAEYIAKALTEAGIAWQPIAKTGILAKIEGRGDRNNAVVLRADIDALPIQEQTDLKWRSEHPGVMHACGHDLHAAILYGVLCRLKDAPFEGTLFGLFQPGEELNPGGAKLVLEEEPFAGYRVKGVIGEHVDSELPVGEFGLCPGPYMAGNDELRFTLSGGGGHAALRNKVRDTVRAAARLILAVTDLNSKERILSIGRVEAPGATNVIPEEVHLEGTMRIYAEADRLPLQQELRSLCEELGREEQLQIALAISAGYPPVENNRELSALAEATAREAGYTIHRLERRPTSEDFGRYGLHYPSLFYRLGVGQAAGRPHTPHFNPDEGAIPAGIDLMRRLALKLLNSETTDDKA